VAWGRPHLEQRVSVGRCVSAAPRKEACLRPTTTACPRRPCRVPLRHGVLGRG
jgi:hypothetical protein